jgi:hypothetical protein
MCVHLACRRGKGFMDIVPKGRSGFITVQEPRKVEPRRRDIRNERRKWLPSRGNPSELADVSNAIVSRADDARARVHGRRGLLTGIPWEFWVVNASLTWQILATLPEFAAFCSQMNDRRH